MNEYKWDIAISLNQKDTVFAKKLVKVINPNLKVFFYEDKQEELINKSGPEAFAKIFKEESRIVVILSRNEWSETYYTEIERNAIIDRTSVKNEGYQFLFVIPMVTNEIPSWYPSTRIYANPHRFSIEELARFIEFKVTEEGGDIKPLTVEDQYKHLLRKIENKKDIIKVQQTKEAIEEAKKEIDRIKKCFNDKITFFKKSIFKKISMKAFSEYENSAYFSINDYLLKCHFLLPNEISDRILTTQDICIRFELYKTFGQENQAEKELEIEERFFYYNSPQNSWAIKYLFDRPSEQELLVLFRNRKEEFYDLILPLSSTEIIDYWFQKLLTKSSENINKYI